MKFNRKVVGSTTLGDIEFNIVADNKYQSRFKNGFSNWNGKIVDDGFVVKFTDFEGNEKETWDITRKGAILQAVYEYCVSKFKAVQKPNSRKMIQPYESLEFKLVK